MGRYAKSEGIAGQMSNDSTRSRKTLRYSSRAEQEVLGAAVWSRRDALGYDG